MITGRLFRLIFGFLFISLTAAFGQSKAVLFSQSFEAGSNPFSNYVLSNVDKGTPADTNWSVFSDSAWVIRKISGTDNHAAVATSSYSPAVKADDWFITPAIHLGEASILSWKSMEHSPGKKDVVEVFVSNSIQSVNGCLLNFAAFVDSTGSSGSFTSHTLDLKAKGFSEQTVYIGFRLHTQSGGDKLAIDDILVTDDSISSVITLTFEVNMGKYISRGDFHPRTDTVDIAGNFNNWLGTGNIMTIKEGSDSTIYTTNITGFQIGDILEFKFRINSSWNDTALEFPYGGPNREWIIEEGKYIYRAFYNEAGQTSSVPVLDPSGFKVYPNPCHENLTVESLSTVDYLTISTLSGNLILERPFASGKARVSTLDLLPGCYVLTLRNRTGFQHSRLFIKY